MRVAVTSANGKLGSSIVKVLKKESGLEKVVGIARNPEKAKFLGVEIRKGDYNSKKDFLLALIDIDAVLLISGMDEPDKRIQQHRNVIEAAKENGVRKIVYTSIYGAEEGNTFSPVVASNRQTELDIKNSGMKWAIGRNGIYIEPDLDYIETYIKDVSEKQKLKLNIKWVEYFPEIVNDNDCVDLVSKAAKKLNKKVIYRENPFTWTEDFSYFTQKIKGAFFGLGAGKDHAQLHNSDYDFPDEIIEDGVNVFWYIIEEICRRS